jgi:hypothetical protein
MIPDFIILLVAVLNLIPARVTTFTMAADGTQTIRFTKQADGGWKGVQLPTEGIGTFYVAGTKLTTKENGKESSMYLAKMLGVEEKTNWSKLKEIKVGSTARQIERKANGVDFVLKEKKGDSTLTMTWKVRWEAKKGK